MTASEAHKTYCQLQGLLPASAQFPLEGSGLIAVSKPGMEFLNASKAAVLFGGVAAVSSCGGPALQLNMSSKFDCCLDTEWMSCQLLGIYLGS